MNWFLTSALLISTVSPAGSLPVLNGTRFSGGYELEELFVPEPRGRGTFGLLWSCIVTFVLCIWTGVHPNILPRSTSASRTIYKAFWMLCAALLPEFTILCAFGQWYKAREIRDLWNKKFGNDDSLGLAGGFFVLMGGFTVGGDEEDEGYALTLTPEGFKECLIWDKIKKGDIHKRFITDKGKASHLAKVLALFQASWFIFQCISRKAAGLPISLLEIHVAIQVVHTWLSYFFWWYKPLDVNEPIKLKMDKATISMVAKYDTPLSLYTFCTFLSCPKFSKIPKTPETPRTPETLRTPETPKTPETPRTPETAYLRILSRQPLEAPKTGEAPGFPSISQTLLTLRTFSLPAMLALPNITTISSTASTTAAGAIVTTPTTPVTYDESEKGGSSDTIEHIEIQSSTNTLASPASYNEAKKEGVSVTSRYIQTEDPTDIPESAEFRKYNIVREKARSGVLNLFLKCVYDVLEYIVGECYGDIRVVGLLFISNGALHLCAWNVHFPTTVEQTIWRVSCLLISLGAIIYIPIVAGTPFEDYLLEAVWELRFSDGGTCFKKTVRRFKIDFDKCETGLLKAVFVFSWLMTLTYAFCIFFITAESVISVRSLLKGAYSTPSWDGDKYFPHLG